jgi:hypothetical protein
MGIGYVEVELILDARVIGFRRLIPYSGKILISPKPAQLLCVGTSFPQAG